MALGHHRRIYLSIPSFLHMAVEGYDKNTGRVDYVG